MADPVQRLQSEIQTQVINIGGIVDGVADRIKGVIGEGIKAVFEPLGAALQGALDLIAQLVGGLLGDLVTPEDFVKSAIDEWLRGWTDERQVRERLTSWVGAGIPGYMGITLATALGGNPPTIGEGAAHDPAVPLHIGETLSELQSKPAWYRWIIYTMATVIMTGQYLQALQSADLSALQQDVLIQNQVTPLTLAELAQAAVQTQVDEDWARRQATRLGITPELFDVVVRTTGNPPGWETMLELWRRGVTDEANVEQALRESSLKNKYIDQIKALRFVLPSPSDLIRFLVRDAFDDTVAGQLATDTDFDQKFNAELFAQVGLSEDLARRFWRAHWQLPSPTQLFEMHHRTSDAPTDNSEPVQLPSGATVHRLVSADFLRQTLQINDLLPPFLDKYRAISFNPPTRVDARRMYLADQFTDDDLFRAFLDEGYTPQFAGQMLTWMQSAKAKAKHEEALKNAAPVIAHVRRMYAAGLLGASEATSNLTDLGVDSDIVALWLRSDDLDREQRRASALRDDLHRLYVAEVFGEDEVATRLENEGYTRAEIGKLLEDWRLDLQLKEESDDQRRARELTKSHVLDAYRDRRVNRSEAAELLRSMGYHADQTEFWLADVDWDTAQKDADTIREAIHADYVDAIVSRLEAQSQLDALNVPSAHSQALLRKWDTERRRKEPRLTIAEVTKLAENQIIPPDQLVAYLRKLRYQDQEIELLQQLWGYDVGVTRERLNLAKEQFAFRQQQAEQARQDRLARQQQIDAERDARQQATEAARIAAEQRATERQLAAEARKAKAQVEAESRKATAEEARHERNVQEALAREERARSERDQTRQLRVEMQQRSIEATDARQQRSFAQQDKTLAQREANAEARFQLAQQARIDAEQRRENAQIDRENRQEQARIRAETRAQEARVATESRSESRQLERELRQAATQQAKEERAQAAKVAQEQRVAQQRAVVAAAQSQAQLQIQQLRDAERQRLTQSAADRQAKVEEATRRRISALQS